MWRCIHGSIIICCAKNTTAIVKLDSALHETGAVISTKVSVLSQNLRGINRTGDARVHAEQ
jgi:hypothetical protein